MEDYAVIGSIVALAVAIVKVLEVAVGKLRAQPDTSQYKPYENGHAPTLHSNAARIASLEARVLAMQETSAIRYQELQSWMVRLDAKMEHKEHHASA